MHTESQKTSQSKGISHLVVTGTVNGGSVGSPIGLVDMGESESVYFFRVSLAGLGENQDKIKVDIKMEGRVCIHGVVPEVAIPGDEKCKYIMLAGPQLCQPGPFTIEFNLPGPIDARLISPVFKHDGILEVVVIKLGVRIPTSGASTSTS